MSALNELFERASALADDLDSDGLLALIDELDGHAVMKDLIAWVRGLEKESPLTLTPALQMITLRIEVYRIFLRNMAARCYRLQLERRLDSRIDALERELREKCAALEARERNLRYVGTWQPTQAETYRKNNIATHGGGLWICVSDAPGRPGVSGWQLAAKGTGAR